MGRDIDFRSQLKILVKSIFSNVGSHGIENAPHNVIFTYMGRKILHIRLFL